MRNNTKKTAREIEKENNKKETIEGKETRSSSISSEFIWIIFLVFSLIGVVLYFEQEKKSGLREVVEERIRNEVEHEQISRGQHKPAPPISPDGDILDSLEASIKYLSKPKFSQIVNSVRDDGSAVYITIEDSIWYNITASQKQQLANRMLDVIYASGDVKRILYLKDEHSRVIAEQSRENIGGISMLRPYMNLR